MSDGKVICRLCGAVGTTGPKGTWKCTVCGKNPRERYRKDDSGNEIPAKMAGYLPQSYVDAEEGLKATREEYENLKYKRYKVSDLYGESFWEVMQIRPWGCFWCILIVGGFVAFMFYRHNS